MQVGIGRAGPLDDPDAGQKSDPAARSVSALKRADQQIAERRDDERGEQDQQALHRLADARVRRRRLVHVHHLDDLQIIIGADHRAEDAGDGERDIAAVRPPR